MISHTAENDEEHHNYSPGEEDPRHNPQEAACRSQNWVCVSDGQYERKPTAIFGDVAGV